MACHSLSDLVCEVMFLVRRSGLSGNVRGKIGTGTRFIGIFGRIIHRNNSVGRDDRHERTHMLTVKVTCEGMMLNIRR